jgi:CheY-like chemotaxis protein
MAAACARSPRAFVHRGRGADAARAAAGMAAVRRRRAYKAADSAARAARVAWHPRCNFPSRPIKEVDMNHALANEIQLYEEEASLRILLAEDSGEMRRLLALVLQRDGHEVVAVKDGGELLDALAETWMDPAQPPFDLILAEQTLPGLPGLLALAGLRSHDRTTSFILITHDAAVATRAQRLGAVVLNHPFNVGAIRAAVRRSIEEVPRGAA